MTEVEWLACDDPYPMLEALRSQTGGWRRILPWLGPQTTVVSQRNLLLFSCACYRNAPEPNTSLVDQRALEMVEASADGGAKPSYGFFGQSSSRRGRWAVRCGRKGGGLPDEERGERA
jgi:hypothetical protein